MGEAVARRVDAAIITSDNPRTEAPADIARPVEQGVRLGGLKAKDVTAIARGERGYVVELDRARAIEAAVLEASPGDVVVVAGKGHEDYQIVGSEKRHFDDREEAKKALAKRSAVTSQRGRLPSVPGPAGVT
jgi:UDP-N-acetylmuramoyl-L-alanyl-D-glutamate--2,6-diaminopimelate ligase